MIWDDLTRLAFDIACVAHNGQYDKSGVPYILHPLRVAENMPSSKLAAVALLHDVIEDTTWTKASLSMAGVPADVIHAVVLLTRKDGADYMNYVAGTLRNVLSASVKKADLLHNSDPARQPKEPTDKDLMRLEKYHKALEVLAEVPDWYHTHN